VNTTDRKTRARMFVLLIKELSRERNLSTRLWRLHTLVFNTPEFDEWFREELAARTTIQDADRAEALRRLLDVGPTGMLRGQKRRKSTLH
jgi:hypothetical protein